MYTTTEVLQTESDANYDQSLRPINPLDLVPEIGFAVHAIDSVLETSRQANQAKLSFEDIQALVNESDESPIVVEVVGDDEIIKDIDEEIIKACNLWWGENELADPTQKIEVTLRWYDASVRRDRRDKAAQVAGYARSADQAIHEKYAAIIYRGLPSFHELLEKYAGALQGPLGTKSPAFKSLPPDSDKFRKALIDKNQVPLRLIEAVLEIRHPESRSGVEIEDPAIVSRSNMDDRTRYDMLDFCRALRAIDDYRDEKQSRLDAAVIRAANERNIDTGMILTEALRRELKKQYPGATPDEIAAHKQRILAAESQTSESNSEERSKSVSRRAIDW